MRYIVKYTFALIVLIASLCGAEAMAQRIVSMNVDTATCLTDSVFVGIGFDADHEVVVAGGETTLSRPGRVFLPDGIPCGTLGCSYRSSVTFDAFAAGAQISSTQDIRYVRLNIEHSYIGDIYIAITCPTGQTASLMNWSGNGSTSCSSTIPQGHRVWSDAYSNASGGTFLGMPVDDEASNKCDSTAYANRPGTGWNYCWSNNTQFNYAGQDALIYRAINAHNGRIDSSNVAAGTNFYKPNQNFNTLVGCPLNGEWYIEVIDGYNVDNGWIFDWELSLNPNLVPTTDDIASISVTGSEVTDLTDSTYLVSVPEGTTTDTTVTYSVHITTTQGGSLDTTFSVHYYPLFQTDIIDTLCSGDTAVWSGQYFTTDTTFSVTLQSVKGCDSIVNLHYTFFPSYEVGDTSLLCPTDVFEYEGVDFGGPIDFDSPHLTIQGCDSLVHVSLIMLDSAFHPTLLMTDDSSRFWSGDTTLLGCLDYSIMVRDTTPMVAQRTWYFGDGDTLATTDTISDHLYDSAGVYTVTMKAVSRHGCVDSVTRKDAVWVFPNPRAEFVWDMEVPGNHNAQAQFYNLSDYGDYADYPSGGNPLTYLWDIENGSGSDTTSEHSPLYHWGEPQNNMEGDYNVTLMAFWLHEGPDSLTAVCADTVQHQITITNVFLQFPNLVTPNGDGVNDRWVVVNLLEYGNYSMNEVWIYDAWGALTYHARDIRRMEDFWDPNETRSPDGTYYFRFSGKGLYGQVKYNGMIEVIR